MRRLSSSGEEVLARLARAYAATIDVLADLLDERGAGYSPSVRAVAALLHRYDPDHTVEAGYLRAVLHRSGADHDAPGFWLEAAAIRAITSLERYADEDRSADPAYVALAVAEALEALGFDRPAERAEATLRDAFLVADENA